MNKPADKCSDCGRGKQYFEGCSKCECPKRKPLTANYVGSRFHSDPLGVKGTMPVGEDGVRVMPSNKE